jgi:hypothetical protein
MTMYYVATLSQYVLVDAPDDASARESGLKALQSERVERRTPMEIRTVRPATADEIELWNWHHDMLKREQRR